MCRLVFDAGLPAVQRVVDWSCWEPFGCSTAPVLSASDLNYGATQGVKSDGATQGVKLDGTRPMVFTSQADSDSADVQRGYGHSRSGSSSCRSERRGSTCRPKGAQFEGCCAVHVL